MGGMRKAGATWAETDILTCARCGSCGREAGRRGGSSSAPTALSLATPGMVSGRQTVDRIISGGHTDRDWIWLDEEAKDGATEGRRVNDELGRRPGLVRRSAHSVLPSPVHSPSTGPAFSVELGWVAMSTYLALQHRPSRWVAPGWSKRMLRRPRTVLHDKPAGPIRHETGTDEISSSLSPHAGSTSGLPRLSPSSRLVSGALVAAADDLGR